MTQFSDLETNGKWRLKNENVFNFVIRTVFVDDFEALISKTVSCTLQAWLPHIFNTRIYQACLSYG